MEFYILIGILTVLYWGISQSRKAKNSSEPFQSDFYQHMKVGEKSEEGKYREKLERKERKHVQKKSQQNKKRQKPNQKGKAESVQPAKSDNKRKLTKWQKAWIMKEIVDQPRALRPYRFRQPR